MLKELLPQDWREILVEELEKPYFKELDKFVESEYSEQQIFPPKEQIFRALEWCAPQDVRVVIIGQDPYHDDGQANGLCFSVADGVPHPPSLRNIFKEVSAQMVCEIPKSGNLERWARQGVLMINAVLTVRAHQAASHANRGWEQFTDAVVAAVAANHTGVVYMLWGNYAKKKGAHLDENSNCLLRAAHPSPLSVRHRVHDAPQFSAANGYFQSRGEAIIEW
ncbi:MAG: uracil-DNA glycosylase [Rikenellaceae bacterium]